MFKVLFVLYHHWKQKCLSQQKPVWFMLQIKACSYSLLHIKLFMFNANNSVIRLTCNFNKVPSSVYYKQKIIVKYISFEFFLFFLQRVSGKSRIWAQDFTINYQCFESWSQLYCNNPLTETGFWAVLFFEEMIWRYAQRSWKYIQN